MWRRGILLLGLISAALLPGCSKSSNSTALSGERVFLVNCASCHQTDGRGVAGTFPPLAGNATVVGDPVKVIHIVKYGLTGPAVAGGKTYDGMMPAWSPQLSDAAIAAAITYARTSWGNKASAVTEDQVSAVSK